MLLKSLFFLFLSIFCSPLCAQNPIVVFETDYGDVEVELYNEKAPLTVSNFLAYVDEDMWQGASFYRVVTPDNQPDNDIRIEVVQGGLGWADSLQRLQAIQHENTKETGVLHLDGVISMARSEPGTASSEFFICVGDQPSLDYGGMRNKDGQGFAAFGMVINGMEVVRRIQQLPSTDQMLDKPVAIKKILRK